MTDTEIKLAKIIQAGKIHAIISNDTCNFAIIADEAVSPYLFIQAIQCMADYYDNSVKQEED